MRKKVLIGSGIGVAAVAVAVAVAALFLVPATTEDLGTTTVPASPSETPKPPKQSR
ncbi:hypothetical protein GCM10010123_14450 [Pilimelia anulata]|uniref:Uncharacterized protein n=1 Tax=Pilimelia anulata TaxID=53371 RepID=A0A8J3F9E4_9ACTN|nr:hypothetical protein [Pilimelia anulata]GGJ85923.1 hypothetical protein GCM10010123_14450 [Pilimelia anulata]